MMENRFDQHFVARDVQFVDNSTRSGPTAAESADRGQSALQHRRYREAIRCLEDAIAAQPDDQMPHFHLALALLQGTRPHRQSRDTLAAVRCCAAAAPDLPEARALAALVAEDAGLDWRRRPTPPVVVAALVADVPTSSAQLVVDHTGAVGAPVYEALRVRLERGPR